MRPIQSSLGDCTRLRRHLLEAFFASSGVAQVQRLTTVLLVLVAILVAIIALLKLWGIVMRRRNQSPDVSSGTFVEVGDRGLVVDSRALDDKNLGFQSEQLALLGEAFKFQPEGIADNDIEAVQDETQKSKDSEDPGQACHLRECIVCLAEYSSGELLRKLRACGHLFHQDCVDAWLSAHRSCPLCRMPLSLQPLRPQGDPPEVPTETRGSTDVSRDTGGDLGSN